MVGPSTIHFSAKTHYVVSNAPTEASNLVVFLSILFSNSRGPCSSNPSRYEIRCAFLFLSFMLTLEEGGSCP